MHLHLEVTPVPTNNNSYYLLSASYEPDAVLNILYILTFYETTQKLYEARIISNCCSILQMRKLKHMVMKSLTQDTKQWNQDM